MIKTIIFLLCVGCLLITIGLIMIGLVLDKGLKRFEQIECQQWEQNSKIYENWYPTDWQKEQCLMFGIELK